MQTISHYMLIAALAFVLLLPATVHAQNATGPTVSVQDDLFRPATLQAPAGATVTWTIDGAETHTITADDGSFDSGVINPGDAFTMTFADAGTFAYYCAIHGGPGGEGMAGTITVSS